MRAAAAWPVQAIVLDRVGSGNGARQAEARRNGADEGFLRSGRIVIVGAPRGAAGSCGTASRVHRLADSDRGRTDEPYDRPPLSKQVIEEWVAAGHTGPPRRDDVEAEWRLGVPATELDLAGQHLHLAGGERVGSTAC